MTAGTGRDPSTVVMALIAGYVPSLALHVAAKLDIAELLSKGSTEPSRLAEECGADELALHRVLRCLAGLGIFAEEDDGSFRNTETSELLRRGHPRSLHAWAVLVGERWVHAPWGHVLESVRTGAPVFEKVFGMDAWSYLAAEPEAARAFQRAMSSGDALFTKAVLAAYPFGEIGHLVDVGGGDGSFLAQALRSFTGLRGTLVERAELAAVARETLRELDASVVEGSFFDALPTGGDAYVLKWIVHNWDDARAARVLTRCREALAPGAKVLLIERVLPSGNTPSDGKILDLNMMVLHGGRERNEVEIASLAERAGLRLDRVIETASPLSVIELSPD